MKRKPKILMVYKCLGYPLRKTVDEHLYSFLRYADAECYYLKLDIGKDTFYSTEPIPNYLLEIDFDIILFHYGFISSRWAGQECYNRALQQVLPLKKSKAIKAVMPQDEYMGSKNICHFVNEMNIDIVFSVSPETEWEQLYGGIANKNVKLFKVLTGYLDDGGIATVNNFLKTENKTIDIGYRARNLPQWLGKHGFLKTIIADEFEKVLPDYKLNTDISTRPTDTFMGNEWYRFMVKCKYMIGVEGGATVHDPDGSIAIKGKEYLRQNPNCSFEEIEAACFPNLDGKLQLIAISPRHLEACATRTCQVLIEGTYNGILKANVHYIPLKEDFSNIHQVLADIKNDSKRKEITDNAYRDIVASGKYCYQNFVKEVIDKCLVLATDEYFNRPVTYGKYYRKNRFQDWLSWKKDYFWHKIYDRLPTKWVVLTPTIKLIKALGLKNAAKKIYFAITGKKKFP
jgi:hypothetical protein